MNPERELKNILRNVLRACRKYRVDFKKILKEILEEQR